MSKRRYPRFSRRANSAIPGYDNLGFEDFGHPASKAQPDAEAYGIDSEFGEGVTDGPYSSGPAPASVGWMADHPASSDQTISDYEDTQSLKEQNLKQAMERKASKCIEIAENRLGKFASQEEVEDLALRYMDLPNRTINAKLQRIASDFLADDMDMMADADLMADEGMAHGVFDEYDADSDGMISRDEWGGSDDMFDALDSDSDGMLSREEVSMGLGDTFAEDMMSDDAMSPAEVLAEEIAMLRSANQKLRLALKKKADESVQDVTGYEGDDEGVDTLSDSEEDGEPTQKLAGLSRLASVLGEMMGEEHDAESHDLMAELLAEMELLAKSYKKHNEYGKASPSFEYQDPAERGARRSQKGGGMWDKQVKQNHNDMYYRDNPDIWGVKGRAPGEKPRFKGKKVNRTIGEGGAKSVSTAQNETKRVQKSRGKSAESVLSEEQFSELLATLEMVARGNKKGKRNQWSKKPYGSAVDGFGYMTPDERSDNQSTKGKSGWPVSVKETYNDAYYQQYKDNWKKKAEDLSAEEQEMLAEMLADMDMMSEDHEADMDMMAEDHEADMDIMAEEEVASDEEILAEMLAEISASEEEASEDHEADMEMMADEEVASEDHEAVMMADEEEADMDIMGLSTSSEGIDPKLARIFSANEEEASEEEASEEEADMDIMADEDVASEEEAVMMADEEEASEEEATLKSASFRPQTTARQSSVKTLGNISREASSASDELSKLWESAPDVSKFF